MIALCVECLRVYDIPPETINYHDHMVWVGNHLCVCGGDVCSCSSCSEEAQEQPGPVFKFSSSL